MLPLEKLYQRILNLADKYDIPTIGMCSGNQHIILYHQGAFEPVANYINDGGGENKHRGILIEGSIPYFLTLTPSEQRYALENCSMPEISLDIATAHHYAGVKGKLG